MPFQIGPLEVIVLLIIVLIIFGPKRLPEMGKSLGRGIREFKGSLTKDESSHVTEQSSGPAAIERGTADTPSEPAAKPIEGEVVRDRKA